MIMEAEYAFFSRLMHNLHIHVHRFPCSEPPSIDLGLCEITGYENRARALFSQTKDNVIYLVEEIFAFSYSYLRLPQSDEILLTGPYLCREVTDQEILMIIEKSGLSPKLLHSLRLTYENLPHVPSEEILITMLTTLGECIWGSADAFELTRVHAESMLLDQPSYEGQTPQLISEAAQFKLMEDRYEAERQLLHLVSQGRTHRAQMIIRQMNENTLESRTADSLRNLKNYGVVLNTLLRKAVEEGGVHPYHIHQLSSQMAKRLEQSLSLDECRQVFSTMVHKYCLLVKNHSIAQYSKLVQHVILRSESDLSADLSLKAHAQALNVNASYLSALFKRETGSTITEYVTRMRIDYAIFLLNATDMQIQSIAHYCGIPDVNYFTRTFKRIIGKTPKDYRLQIRS
ncbi:MAG: helix-turn-helix transcriptional regulator [Clostridia bacterium]|nr:helix-turn-helix transcriptional regulator [Clostridia bacterium]